MSSFRRRSLTALAGAGCVLALIFLAPLPAAFAWGGYAYNYSFDFERAPYHAPGQNISLFGPDAAVWEAAAGYTAKSYDYCTASAFVNNLKSPALGIMFVASHSNAGHCALVVKSSAKSLYYPYPYGYTSNVTSNWSFDIADYGVPVYDITGETPPNVNDWIIDYKRIKDIVIPGTKLVVYEGCSTGADPPPPPYPPPMYTNDGQHHNLLWETIAPNSVIHNGAACAVGFTKEIYEFAASNGWVAGDLWASQFSYYCEQGWSFNVSQVAAWEDVYNNFSNDEGFASVVNRGSGTMTY